MRDTHRSTDMDVTFTDVLEGVRQYFQGLPAGSNETGEIDHHQQPPVEPTIGGGAPVTSPQTGGAAPTYPVYDPPPAANPPIQPQMYHTQPTTSANNHNTSYNWPERDKTQNEQRKNNDIVTYQTQGNTTQNTHLIGSYNNWSGREKPQEHKVLNETLTQTSNQNYWTSELKVHERLQNHAQNTQETPKLIQNYHYQHPTPNSYQYTRTHVDNQTHHMYPTNHQNIQPSRSSSRSQEIPAPNYQQIKPSTHTENIYINGYPQRSQETLASKNYQQLQTPKTNIATSSHTDNMYINGYTQNNSYYPTRTKPHSPTVAPPSSTQNYQTPISSQYLSYSTHSQSPVQTQTQYLSAKNNTEHYETKSELQRRTHNLPPIAALSSVNYHSNKTRESTSKVSAIQNRQNYPTVPRTINNVAPTNTVASSVYLNAQQSRPSAIYTHQSRSNTFTTGIQNPTGSQVRYNNIEPHFQYPVTSSTYPSSSNSSSNSSKQVIYPQSSYTQYFQKPQKIENQIPQPNQNVSNQRPNSVKDIHRNAQPTVTNINTPNRLSLEAIKKRESPLDLSVKTVRTTADSTALDESESDQRYGTVFRNKYLYQNGSYIVKDNQNVSYQRSLIRNTNPSTASAPKVDFLPNFSASALHNQTTERQQTYDYNRTNPPFNQNNIIRSSSQIYRTNSQPILNNQSNLRHNSLTGSTYQINRNNDNKMDTLPRFELPIEDNGYRKPTINYQNHDNNRKRTISETQTPAVVPNKVSKVDNWRLKIDQQIEQKLSSCDNARVQPENYKSNEFVKPAINNINQKPLYTNQYYPQGHTYRNNVHSESHTSNHQFVQQYTTNTDQYDGYLQNPTHRNNSVSKLLPQKTNNTNNGGADKRILSILRNSLEIKKEAQKKLEQIKPNILVNAQSGIQHPSTDVTAPLQPKPSIHSRHNVSPFTASSLERNSNTPPNHKYQCPRAIDSVKFELDTVIKDEHNQNKYPTGDVNTTGNDSTHPVGANTGSESLDGLAAFLAARIRTKGERKQLTSTELLLLQKNNPEYIEKTSTTENILISNIQSPPKLNRELNIQPSRRKLFGKNEDEQNIPAPINGGSLLPHRNTLRSSSETSVFDFRESDSEGEMPVLERQSLEDMRRDRKTLNRTYQTPLINDSINNVVKNEEPEDLDWAEMCNKFCEQLQNNVGKKRGRRKRFIEPEVIAKLETVTKEKPIDIIIKQEIIDETDITSVQPEILEIKKEIIEEETNIQDDSDSDVPLTNIKRSIKKEQTQSDEEGPITKKPVGAKTRIEYSSDSDSDDNTDKIDSVSRNLFNRKSKRTEKDLEKMVLRSADSSPVKKTAVNYLKKKALFGDGSDFTPGWEDELYKYKRSIRMPARLITVSRPHWHRMSTSLPDLDACSPAPSSLTDDIDFTINHRKLHNSLDSKQIKRDIIDSDSNSSFSFQKGNDFDEASCSSLKMKKSKNSIVDVLVERVVKYKKRRNRSKETKNGPKIIEKSSNLLLPTPSLGIGNSGDDKEKKKGKIKVKEKEENKTDSNSFYLGYFRKETVNNFRDQFKNTGGLLNEPFSTIVLKSRTRKETRVMKQRATIREVFGEDRPASAPPMTCHEEQINEDKILEPIKLKEKNNIENETKEENKSLIREGLRSAKSPTKKTYHLTRKYTFKNTNSETNSVASTDEVVIKSETPSINGDETSDNSTVPIKRKYKFTKMRRKFSSGFDYIRKKKKVIKKDGSEDGELKPKRRGFPSRQDPECEEDIQKEIKTWVMNKGVGETHLHRAARLGYSDVTAYCLEKMNSFPSPKDNAGYTPLHEACSRGHLDIARLLLLYGANVSESAQGGIRPLHEAAENGYVEIIRLLLSYGADPRLATYSGLTPLSLATDEETKYLLKNYISDMEALSASPWMFNGPAACFDNENSGYNALEEAPSPEPESDVSDIEMEISETALPNQYILKDEPPSERWILLQDLSVILKIKSRDALLKQINPNPGTHSSASLSKTLIKEMKFNDFMDKAHCCTLFCAGEKINVRSSKIALVKYTDKVKKLLGVEKFTVPAR